ncbi:low molecular weight protein-tyrosine-phosphatase [Flavobacterium oreochromis]|uniref:protein-tyrosine-phosphatase n=2 Tax=Flavobacterium TaxID=237 RepID=A0A246GB96_9FLAO|nr:low molecular weight protein-tyrosine-phosphatase [Flavobacterium oreochromis]OWP77042.1 protein-tyrosine-phosphatase [Flavobacterium oreochromis]OWP77807.1 protein-tyrosine-phosphatase [Flavobacterium oreochromis]POR28877.1 protein-tyrosine-phosphatase [Flavobacterium columnare]QYS85375.1 low molecular weight phosphotyrosine protein phosphatase [Flavobacterium oreochromis]
MSKKILMVCLGNICRSPLAEGILKSKLPKTYLIDSAGTGGWHTGEQPDKRSIQTARSRGIDISQQRARKFQKSDFDIFDQIFVMDNQNYKDVINQAITENQKKKVQLILEEVFPGKNLDVPDPYYGGQDGFEHVFDMLDQACQNIANKLEKKSS